MYKVGSDKHQAALHRGKLADWVGGDFRLSPPDRLKQLQEGARILETRILALPPGAERSALGKEKFELQNELAALRKEFSRSVPPDWKSHFVNEAKRILSASKWEMIYNAATREAERELAKKADSTPPTESQNGK